MSNKTIDKRDLVLNQAEEILLNMLKDHTDNEFCRYLYFEFTLGTGIKQNYIDYIKNNILKKDGTFKVKERGTKYRESEQFSMNDLLDELIYFLNVTLRNRIPENRVKEIVEKYGNTTYFEGMKYYLKEVFLDSR